VRRCTGRRRPGGAVVVGERSPPTSDGSLRDAPGHDGIHVAHVSGCSSIHCFAASSGDMFLLVMRSATSFWSVLPHLKFLMNVAALPAEFIHSVRTTLFRTYGG